jgi:hypothetical protein
MSRAALLAAALLLAPASASAATPVERSRDLWATVNICDSAGHPNYIGVRGSMPGLGRRAQLYMRIQIHYLAAADGKWHNLESKGDSGYMKLGVARKRVIEGGFSVEIKPPADGGAHTMRGAVTFIWKRSGRTVKRLREITEAGHKSTKGADPAGFSAAICQIS